MCFVKINPEIFHFTLHGFIFHADLDNLGMAELTRLPHRLEHLAVQDGRAAGAAIFGEQARAVDVEPVRAFEFAQQGQPAEGEELALVFCNAAETSG